MTEIHVKAVLSRTWTVCRMVEMRGATIPSTKPHPRPQQQPMRRQNPATISRATVTGSELVAAAKVCKALAAEPSSVTAAPEAPKAAACIHRQSGSDETALFS